jgi:hypothetical protein
LRHRTDGRAMDSREEEVTVVRAGL